MADNKKTTDSGTKESQYKQGFNSAYSYKRDRAQIMDFAKI